MKYWWLRIRRWMKRRDIVMKLVALLASVLLWNYVMGTKNPTRTLNYSVPVKLTGVEQIYNIYGLSVIEGGDTTVTVRVSAPSSRIANLTASQITAEADLASVITEPGEYEIPCSIKLPESTMTAQKVTPQTIKVSVDRTETKSIPVEVKLTEDAGTGYRCGDITTDVTSVEITGPERNIERISMAVINVDASDLTRTAEQSYDYTLVDSSGHAIETDHITKKTTRVMVRIPIERVKSVPLEVQITPQNSAAAKTASVTIEPSTVEIVGDPTAVEGIESIVIGSFNVNNAKDGDTASFQISLPKGVQLTDGQPTTAHATLKMDQMLERTIVMDDIQINDDAETPSKVTLLTDSLEVTVSGAASVVNALSADDLKVLAEIDSQDLSKGTHKVGVQIESPDGVTVVGNYSVSIRIE